MSKARFAWILKKERRRWYDLRFIGSIVFFLIGIWIFYYEQGWKFPTSDILVFFALIAGVTSIAAFFQTDVKGAVYDDCVIVEDPDMQKIVWDEVFAWKYSPRSNENHGSLIIYLKETGKRITGETYHKMKIISTDLMMLPESDMVLFLETKLGKQLETQLLPGHEL